MRPSFFAIATFRHIPAPCRVDRFYPALLALSLMLGKIYFAQAQPAPISVPGSPVVVQQLSALDNDVRLARDAFEKRDLKALAGARDKFSKIPAKSHALSAYVQYWWLSANLAQAGTFAITNGDEIKAILNANAASVVADSLRRDWLKVLGKLDRWDLFAAELPLLNTEDMEITCHNWRYRLSRNDRDALTEVKAFWVAARAAPDACSDVFSLLVAEKMLSPDDAWMRVRRLLENNQLADARRSAILVPQVPSSFERATAVVGQNPAHYLQREKLQPASRASIELFLFAVTRLARTDADQAATLLDAHGKKLSESDRGYAWAQVGLYGGVQHDQGALGWYERAANFPLNDTQATWKVRAALRRKDVAGIILTS